MQKIKALNEVKDNLYQAIKYYKLASIYEIEEIYSSCIRELLHHIEELEEHIKELSEH